VQQFAGDILRRDPKIGLRRPQMKAVTPFYTNEEGGELDDGTVSPRSAVDAESETAQSARWLARHQGAAMTSTGIYIAPSEREGSTKAKKPRRSLKKYASSSESAMSSGGESAPDPRIQFGGRRGKLEQPKRQAIERQHKSSLVSDSVYRRRWAGDDVSAQHLKSGEATDSLQGNLQSTKDLSIRMGFLANALRSSAQDPFESFEGSDLAGLRLELERLRAKSVALSEMNKEDASHAGEQDSTELSAHPMIEFPDSSLEQSGPMLMDPPQESLAVARRNPQSRGSATADAILRGPLWEVSDRVRSLLQQASSAPNDHETEALAAQGGFDSTISEQWGTGTMFSASAALRVPHAGAIADSMRTEVLGGRGIGKPKMASWQSPNASSFGGFSPDASRSMFDES